MRCVSCDNQCDTRKKNDKQEPRIQKMSECEKMENRDFNAKQFFFADIMPEDGRNLVKVGDLKIKTFFFKYVFQYINCSNRKLSTQKQ